jgi:hypothetical protein
VNVRRSVGIVSVLLVCTVAAVAASVGSDRLAAQEPIPFGISEVSVGCWPGSGPGSGEKYYGFVGVVFSDMLGDEQQNRVPGVWTDGVFTASCTRKTSFGGAYSNEWGLAEMKGTAVYRRGCTVRWQLTSVVAPPGYVYDRSMNVEESAEAICGW